MAGPWRTAGQSPIIGSSLIHNAGWSSPVAREAHNLEVTGSNPVPATCLVAANIGRPQGSTKGRCRPASAFLRFIASYAKGLRPPARPSVSHLPPRARSGRPTVLETPLRSRFDIRSIQRSSKRRLSASDAEELHWRPGGRRDPLGRL